MQMKTTSGFRVLTKCKNANAVQKTFAPRDQNYVCEITASSGVRKTNGQPCAKFFLLRLKRDEREEADCDFVLPETTSK